MIADTRIIILRSIDYQESSKILTVLSAEHGKMALIAKGAKKPKSKLAGLLDIGNILDAIYYYKPNRGVQTLTEASIFYSSGIFRKDFQRASILYATLELISQLVHEHEVNLPVFNFGVNFIQWLGKEEETYPSVFPYVQIRLAEIIGIGIRSNLNESFENAYLNIANGEISGSSDEDLSYKLSEDQALFMQKVLNSQSSSVFSIGLENGELKQLVNHLDVYFKYHIEGYKQRRSDSIFEQMI